jgi:hypothetical protein
LFEFQVFLEPHFIVFRPLGNRYPVVRTTEHHAERDQDHFPQIVPFRRPDARIFQSAEYVYQAHQASRLKSRVDRIH